MATFKQKVNRVNPYKLNYERCNYCLEVPDCLICKDCYNKLMKTRTHKLHDSTEVKKSERIDRDQLFRCRSYIPRQDSSILEMSKKEFASHLELVQNYEKYLLEMIKERKLYSHLQRTRRI